jgi:endoglucanase
MGPEYSCSGKRPIKGFKNLMYTVNFYAATHKKPIRSKTEISINKGLPIFISECAGMETSGNCPINYL